MSPQLLLSSISTFNLSTAASPPPRLHCQRLLHIHLLTILYFYRPALPENDHSITAWIRSCSARHFLTLHDLRYFFSFLTRTCFTHVLPFLRLALMNWWPHLGLLIFPDAFPMVHQISFPLAHRLNDFALYLNLAVACAVPVLCTPNALLTLAIVFTRRLWTQGTIHVTHVYPRQWRWGNKL